MGRVLAVFVTFLPIRYWRGAAGIGILFSGLIQLGMSLAGLVSVYSRFAESVSDSLAELTVEAALENPETGGRVRAGHAMALGALTPIGFLAVSRTGQLCVYLVFSALIRLLGYATDHPCGDPLLTVIDGFAWDFIYAVRTRALRAYSVAASWWFR